MLLYHYVDKFLLHVVKHLYSMVQVLCHLGHWLFILQELAIINGLTTIDEKRALMDIILKCEINRTMPIC